TTQKVGFDVLTGSSMVILYGHCFNRLRPEIKSQMVPTTTSMTGFSGETIWPLGQLRLLVIIGDTNHSTRAQMNFMIVRSLSPYNGIIGRPGIRAIQVVPSTVHGMLKFPIEGGIVTIRSTVLIPTECTSMITSSAVSKEERTRPANCKVALHPDFPDQQVAIEGILSDKGRTELCSIMRKNLDIFAWQPFDMTGVPRGPKTGGGRHHERDLNKACPQDCYPLPEIDWKVESLCGYPFKCFLDAYKGYHQIQLAEPDEEKTTFHTGPRTSVKGQILADFLIKMSSENPQAAPAEKTQQEPWMLFTDGWSSQMGVKDVHVSIDSKLVANQVIGAYVAKEDNMVLVEVLKDKFIKEKEVAAVIEEDGPTWMTPIVDYLKEGTLLGAKKEAGKLRLKARQYELIEGVLYRWSFLTSWLRCVGPLQAEYVMREIHEGSCIMHTGPRSVIHRPITRSPQQPLTLITAPWPFYKWGIDIAGPFLEGPGKVKFLIVATDYFTKWIEAKAVATITGRQVKKFVWDSIVCHFGIPGEIVLDNGKQFSDNPFKDWCDKLNITQQFASVKHPQSNGLVESANRSLGEGIKSRLDEGNKNWVEELPHVLLAHRTMIKSSHGDTPFFLSYGTEAVIPTEIGMPIYCTAAVDVVSNDEELRLNLDMLEERHERAAICEAKAKLKMTKYYNAWVRGVTFKPGDFVYRSNDASHAVAGGKLGPKWEGPYEVTKALGDGAYKLRSRDGTILPRTWNIANLKRCYI
nr:reverse transcriptase domain-containing protein [Tanacetum cinerariifolium]